MKQQDYINRLRDELAHIVAQSDANTAMGLTDHNKIAEDLVCGLMREILGLQGLRNVNATERDNYPAIDLADFEQRIAIQVTGSTDLSKIKDTIAKFLKYDLDGAFDRLIVYVLTRKQRSYSQNAIGKVTGSRLTFNATSDILDYTDLLQRAAHLKPARLAAALRVVLAYNRGVPVGLAEEDFDPPDNKTEEVTLNLVQLFFPSTLYVADILSEYLERPKNVGHKGSRELLRIHGRTQEKILPSDFHIYNSQLLTFRDLRAENNPFAWAVDAGTIVDLAPEEFYAIDDAQERVFKALLRFTLQEKLFRERVMWQHDVKLFAFMPLNNDDMERTVYWQDVKQSERHVYQQYLSKKNADKVRMQKHFAFGVDFYLLNDEWLMSLTPDWYFSWGENFGTSRFAADNISWLKRRENNAVVEKHFRFVVTWLTALDTEDMFSEPDESRPSVSVGEPLSLEGHPELPDEEWLPTRKVGEKDASGDLFLDREATNGT